MIEIKIHGIGGQGAVLAAKLLADAAARGGYQAQAFASYGAEIRGGKVESYVRISEERITLHSKMYEPDYIVLMDDNLAQDGQLLSGVKRVALINSSRPPEAFSSPGKFRVATVDAYRIASDQGLVLPNGTPIINTAILGAIAGMIPFVSIDALAEAIREGGIPRAEKNMKASQEAYNAVKLQEAGGTVSREAPGSETAVRTESYPVFHPEKMPRCNRCLICYISCPELAITIEDPFSLAINRELCKACGICIYECPRQAISWEGEAS